MDSIKKILKALLFFAVGFVILYVLYQRQDEAYMAECAIQNIAAEDCNFLQKIWDDMASAKWIYIFIALVLFMISNVARALRWNILLEPLGYKPNFYNNLGAVMIGYLANLGIPRSGEFVRAGVLARYEDYEAEKVMGTIVTDRLADVISLLVVIGLAFLTTFSEFATYFENHPEYLGKFQDMDATKIVLSLAGIGIVVLYLLYRQFKATAIVQKIIKTLQGFWEGILSITKLRQPWTFLLYSVTIWLCYYLMTYIVFFSFVPTENLGPVAGLVVFVFGTFGILIPSPGGMGTYHFLISEGLGLYGVNGNDAFSLANILFFSVQLLCNVLFGILALVLLPILNRR